MYLNNFMKQFCVIGLLFIISFGLDAHLKLYTFYTPSHKILFDQWFLPSLQDEYDLIVETYEQECLSARFLSPGWTKTTYRKIELILRAILENWGDIFIYSDVDVQFFGKTEAVILKNIKDKDIILQREDPYGGLCTGFFVCRANEKTLHLFRSAKNIMHNNKKVSDQEAINRVLKQQNYWDIQWGYLPDVFFGGGLKTGKLWKIGMSLIIPNDIVMHHANFSIGIPTKIAQLEYVRDLVLEK